MLRSAVTRADGLAVALADRPALALGGLLALDAVLAGLFIVAGLAINGDQALLFRELAPGTLLSFAQLLLISAVAWAIHRRDSGGQPWHRTLWGLVAVIFLVFAFDEITQSAIFLSHGLESLGLKPAAGFHDLEAVLLLLLFAGAGLVLLPRMAVLLSHPRALAILAVAVLLGVASQGLDSFAPATRWEFVAEESLKLATEVGLVAGFLIALRSVLGRSATRSGRAASAPQAA